ncbi:hypothetical protein JOQ06_018411 [Pogonophryne albipinna]|uniref:Agouti domain-containing protein n=1 Tax=Pogonophryne albipinna TaxID=1090488 RepID=A0AAD6AJT0_9TELE|nr:hypothetical protein JOQ06_018411 [Pogonophryne albipinna]
MCHLHAAAERQLVTVMMKITFIWLSFLPLAFASGGLFRRSSDLQTTHSNVTVSSTPAPQRQQTPNAVPPNQGRQRPLFARRGHYERQRVQVPKPKVVPVRPNKRSKKVPRKPMKDKCSQLKQSCLPLFGCCDTNATCHCRFFNAICFCRRIKS